MDRWEATIDAYTLVKFLHVTLAIIWLGGRICLNILGWRVIRANDSAGLATIVQQIAYYSAHAFIPSALLTLISGVIMAWTAGLFGELMGNCRPLGYLATFGLGVAALKPRLEKVSL
jgi:uncharacterized membrane protein